MEKLLFDHLFKLTREHGYATMMTARILEDHAVLERAQDLGGNFTVAECLRPGADKTQADQAAQVLVAAGWVARGSKDATGRTVRRYTRTVVRPDVRQEFRQWCADHQRDGFTTDEAMLAVFGRVDMRRWAVAEIRALGIRSLVTSEGRRWKAHTIRPGDPGYKERVDKVTDNAAVLIGQALTDAFNRPGGKFYSFGGTPAKRDDDHF